MSLRDLIDLAYRTLVDDVRSTGRLLYDAMAEVDSWFDPPPPPEVEEVIREREAAARNAQVLGSLTPLPKPNRPSRREATA